MSLNDIIFNILLSITASFFFWIFTFKVSFAKIVFSKYLAKPDDTLSDNRKLYGYRFRFINIGYRDLIELTVTIKIVIAGDTRSHVLVPDISNFQRHNFITFLPGMITYKFNRRSNMRTMTFYPSESMQNELSKSKYPKNIRKLAKKGMVQFKDIFEEYGENVTIRIFIYGNDRVTGARKMFESQLYTMYDIVEGDFIGGKTIHLSFFDRKKEKIDKISKIHKKLSL